MVWKRDVSTFQGWLVLPLLIDCCKTVITKILKFASLGYFLKGNTVNYSKHQEMIMWNAGITSTVPHHAHGGIPEILVYGVAKFTKCEAVFCCFLAVSILISTFNSPVLEQCECIPAISINVVPTKYYVASCCTVLSAVLNCSVSAHWCITYAVQDILWGMRYFTKILGEKPAFFVGWNFGVWYPVSLSVDTLWCKYHIVNFKARLNLGALQ